jgi:dTDP-4-amino-4,6-dideoxygalactose transaminase
VFCDVIGDDDLTLDPADVEAAITPATRALIVMHYGGHPCRMDDLLEIAERHDLAIVEDAAHAPGAAWDGRSCGGLGAVGCFSFFANKNLPTGEGGMVVTDDPELAERIRLMRSHGMTTLTWDRHRGHAHTYDVVQHGYNYRLDEIRSAIASVGLGRLEAENAQRAKIVAHYREALDGVRGLVIPFAPDQRRRPAHHLAVAVLPRGVDRDAVREQLKLAGVQTSVHYPPIHRFTAYADIVRRELPVTDELAPRLVTLPLFPHMTGEQIDTVVASLLEATG